MRSFWSKIPMLRVALAFIAGILLCIYTGCLLHTNTGLILTAGVLIGLCVAGLFLFNRLPVNRQYSLRLLNGAFIYTGVVCLGYLTATYHVQEQRSAYFGNYIRPESLLTVLVTEPPVEKERSVQVIAQVQQVQNADTTFGSSGKILLYISRKDSLVDVHYGDVIMLRASVTEPDGPHNPKEFDYRRYLQYKNIYRRAFIKEGEWKVIKRGEGNPFMSGIYKTRHYFLSLVAKYVTDENDFGVASAITLGYNDFISTDVTQAFAASGVLHVLSVSGLHVGIMFVMLNFLLKWMDKRGHRWKVAKTLFIIVFIWLYACLTGLSAPVLRSALMFSMLQAAPLVNRSANTYNVLAASALILMLFNPFVITQTGFQLSYIAVAGIVFLYPKISGWVTIITPNTKGLKWYIKPFYLLRHNPRGLMLFVADAGWQLCAVSIAAQLATLPLSLYCFHQFPVLFLFTNLIVIPLSNLVLFAGTFLFITGAIPYVNVIAGFVFKWLLHGLDKFIFWVQSFPFALVEGISITVIEMLLLYGVLLLWYYLSEVLKPRVLIASLLLLLAWSGISAYRFGRHSQQKIFVVYAVPHQSAVAFMVGNTVEQDFDSALLNNKKLMSFYVHPHWINRGVMKEYPLPVSKIPPGCLAEVDGKRVIIANSSFINAQGSQNKLKVDWVVLSNNARISLTNLQSNYDFKCLILDSSNKPYVAKKAKDECMRMGVKCWDVNTQGAYLEEFE